MDENVQSENVEEQVEEKAPELSNDEVRAMQKGWRPKDQWDGDPDEWIDAREFNLREPIFKQLEITKKMLKEQQKVVEDLKRYNLRIEEGAYKKALETLRQEKKQALIDGDADRLLEIDEQIAETRAKVQVAEQAAKQVQPTQLPEEFVEWINENTWYQVNPVLQRKADELGYNFKKMNPEKSPAEVLKYVEREIKKTNPALFSNPAREQAKETVDTEIKQAPTRGTTKKLSEANLTEAEKRAMDRFVRNDVMTKQQYLESLDKYGK